MKQPPIVSFVVVFAFIAAALFAFFIVRDAAFRIRYHKAAMRRATHIIEVMNGAVPQTPADRATRMFGMLTGKRSDAEWGDSYDHHRTALVRLGYLSQREFVFSGGAFPAGKFDTNFASLMRDGISSCTFLSNGVMRVFAPPSQMACWASLVRELESRQKP